VNGVYFAAYLDRVNVGFAKLQMLRELGFSETVYGFGAGIFFLGYVLFEVPSNVILHRVGARMWIARIMITWALISGAMVFVKTLITFYVLRFLLGVAEAGFIPGILLYLTYWYPAHRRGRITAIFLAAIPMSSIFGGPLSGWILNAVSGAYGLSGWQWLFLLETVPSLILGFVTLAYLDDRVASAKWLDADEKRVIAGNIAREEKDKEGLSHLSDAFRTGQVWLLGLIYILRRERHLRHQLLAAEHHQADRGVRPAADRPVDRRAIHGGYRRNDRNQQQRRPHARASLAHVGPLPDDRDRLGADRIGGRQHPVRDGRADPCSRRGVECAGGILELARGLPWRRRRGCRDRAGQCARQYRGLR